MPVITHLGFDLSVVLLQKGNYSRLGKALRKKVGIKFPSNQPSVSLSSTLVDLSSSIRTFISDYTSIHNAILIPDYASIDIIFSLSQLANEFNLFLITSARASDAGSRSAEPVRTIRARLALRGVKRVEKYDAARCWRKFEVEPETDDL